MHCLFLVLYTSSRMPASPGCERRPSHLAAVNRYVLSYVDISKIPESYPALSDAEKALPLPLATTTTSFTAKNSLMSEGVPPLVSPYLPTSPHISP